MLGGSLCSEEILPLLRPGMLGLGGPILMQHCQPYTQRWTSQAEAGPTRLSSAFFMFVSHFFHTMKSDCARAPAEPGSMRVPGLGACSLPAQPGCKHVF